MCRRTTRCFLCCLISMTAVLVSGCTCDTLLEPDPSADAAATNDAKVTSPETADRDGTVVEPDLVQQNQPCQKCPEATASNICLAGHVFLLPSLSARWSGKSQVATPLTNKAGAIVRVDESLFAGTKPLATASIVTDGCFTAGLVTTNWMMFGSLVVAVDDDIGSGNDHWAYTASVKVPAYGQNSQELEIAAISSQDAQAWGNDLLSKGSMIMVFLDKSSRKAVEGITPLFKGNPPPWIGQSVYVFDEDISKPPYFDLSASTTTKSGMVAVSEAQKKGEVYSGEKTGCTVETGPGGSTPGTFYIRIYLVSGC